jgi:hypothetical protein
MAVTKITRKQWAQMIERGMRKHEFLSARGRLERFWRYMNKHKAASLALGLVAITIYVNLWGVKELFKTAVTYTIIITLLATLVAGITQPKK